MGMECFWMLESWNYSLTNSLIHMFEPRLVARTNKSFFRCYISVQAFDTVTLSGSETDTRVILWPTAEWGLTLLILWPTAEWGLTHFWFCDPQQNGDWHTFDSVTHNRMGTDTLLIPWPTTEWGLTHVWLCDPQHYGDWHTFDSVTHNRMGTDTRVTLWPTALWGLTHFWFCDPQQ